MSTAETTEPAPPPAGAESAFPAAGGSFWPPLLIALAVLAVYANAWTGPFVMDDITSIRDNPTIQRLWPIWNALSPPAGKGLTPNGRPLVNLSFAVNYAIGGANVWSYHGFNVGIHLLAALALYGVVRRTLRRSGFPAADPVAFATALLWSVHPLVTESVTYMVQRAESMMALFYLLTLYCFIRSAEDSSPLSGTAEPSAVRRRWEALSVLACLSGMLCKEVMVSAPLMVLLYDRTFVSGSFRTAWSRHRGLFCALAATWLALFYEVAITGNRGGTAAFGSHVVWWRYALTQFPAIAHYLRLCVWPHPLIFDYGIGLAWQGARALPGAAVVIALLAGVGLALVRWPALGFIGAAFFFILAPSSSVVPIATETMAERRMYLPLAAVIVLAVIALYRGLAAIFSGDRRASSALLALTLLFAVALGVATARRNRDYASNLALWTATARDYPRNMRGLYNLGCALSELGRTAEAVKEFETVVQNQPGYTDAHENLANGLVKLGRTEESIVHYEIAANDHPDSADLQCSLAIALLDTDRVEPAVKHLQTALKLSPGMTEAKDQLGEAFLRLKRPAEALPLLQAAAHDRPNAAPIRNALGNALLQLGRTEEAADSYREAVRLKPDLAEARNNLGNVLLQLGRPDDAIPEFRAAIRIQPDFGEAHNNLGDALLDARQPAAALGEFQEAVRLKPDSADAHYNWANSLAKSGQLELAAAQYREVLRIRPEFAEAHNNLGIALVRLDQLPAARAEFAAALRLKPDYAEARDNLAKVAELLGAGP